MNRFRFLDLSGFMFSGKGAVHDFVSELDGFWTPGIRNEFDLLRVKDGVADLESAVASWSPIRADAAARRFLRIVKKMARGNRGLDRLFAPGFGYTERYPDILRLAEEFIDAITARQWTMYWPYHLLDMSPAQILCFKLRRKFLGANRNVSYRLVSSEHFYDALRNFLHALLTQNIERSKYHTVVLNNAFEPFDPARFLRYFDDARCIVVDRDARDIYVAANQFSHGFNDQVELYRRIAGGFDTGVFIDRIRIYRRQISQVPSERVLRLLYEDVVQDYERTASRIYAFLGVEPSAHVRKRQVFDPEKSRANIGLWRQFADQNAIREIERAFPALV